MINKCIYGVLTKGLKEREPKLFLCSFLHFLVNKIDMYRYDLKYTYAKIRNTRINNINITVNGYLMQINFNDKGISKELFVHKKREHFSTEFMKKFIDKDDIVIDIGANIGYYVLLESNLANQGKIYAVEPILSNIDILNKNILLNNSKNVSIYRYAISDKEGIRRIHIYDKSNWCSFAKIPDGTIIDEVDVPTVTLDTFVRDHVSTCPTFIRMDVEGHEYQIIKGALKIIKEDKPLKLFIELHYHLMPRENFVELLNILKSNRFKVKAVFLEIEPYSYDNIKILNKMRKTIGFPEFGFIGNTYEDINRLSKRMYTPCVFLERE